MVPGIQVRLAEIRRGWVRKSDGFLPRFVHRTENAVVEFVGGAPGIPAGFRWQIVGGFRDGCLYGRLASALRAVPAPAMAFGSGRRSVRVIRYSSDSLTREVSQ